MEENKKRKKLIETNEISASTGKNMITRVIVALVLLGICLPCVFIGSWAFFILVFILSIFAIYEISIAPRAKKVPIILYIAFYAITLSFIYWAFVRNTVDFINNPSLNDFYHFFFGYTFHHHYNNSIQGIYISVIMVALSFIIYFVACITNENFTFKDVCYFFTMSILIGIGMQSLYFIRYLPNYTVLSGFTIFNDNSIGTYIFSSFLFIFVLIGTIINDIGAYFVGVLFGKHKINERISPKKTVEGFIGGILISFIIAITFAFTSSALGVDLLPGYLDIQHWYYIVILAILMPVVANIGDFAFSAIKRNFNIKDFSNIIPGHGGVMDRLDSILFTFIFVSCFLTLIINGFGI